MASKLGVTALYVTPHSGKWGGGPLTPGPPRIAATSNNIDFYWNFRVALTREKSSIFVETSREKNWRGMHLCHAPCTYSPLLLRHWDLSVIEILCRFIPASRQWRRNGGGDGGARPRNVETTGTRVSFRLRNIFPHFCMLFLKLPLFVVVLPTYN